MINLKIISLSLAFFTGTSSAEELFQKGYRLPEESVVKDFTLMRLTPNEDYLIKYILKTNHRIVKSEAREIAFNILKVSECFKIDPWVLTGLIQKESTFNKNAVSPTNAVGLTQFTTLGFKEVNDQLGLRGRAGATENATLYFTSKIRSCVDPSWIDLWNRVDVEIEDPQFYNLLKQEIKNDIQAAITYGAILLKTYTAYIETRVNLEQEKPIPTSEIYYRSLQIYNGEEGDAKVKYAKAIFKNLQNLYPSKVNFPFLVDGY